MPLDAGDPSLDARVDDGADDRLERALVCAACGQEVTSARSATTVAGRHHHTFMNPSADVFHVRCFADAPGAALRGPATDEYSWFPGLAWRIALCRGCGSQLGWSFQPGPGGAVAFFGLIAERLLERGD